MDGVDDGRGAPPAATPVGRASPVPFSIHGTLNLVFLFVFLAVVLALGSLGVAPKSGRVTLPFSDSELPDTCQHVLATGRPCPSCGVTRSVIYALHGDPDRAREYHPAGFPIVVMLFLQIAMRVVFLQQRRRSAALDIAVSGTMIVAFAVLLNTR